MRALKYATAAYRAGEVNCPSNEAEFCNAHAVGKVLNIEIARHHLRCCRSVRWWEELWRDGAYMVLAGRGSNPIEGRDRHQRVGRTCTLTNIYWQTTQDRAEALRVLQQFKRQLEWEEL